MLHNFDVELHIAPNSVQSHLVIVIIPEWCKEKHLKDNNKSDF